MGGPASHAPEVAGCLHGARARRRGGDDRSRSAGARALSACTGCRGALPNGVRHARRPCASARAPRRADVVYTTGMFGRSAARPRSPRVAVRRQADRRPGLRARAAPRRSSAARRGVPGARRRAPGRALRARARRALGRAAHVFCPSAYLRDARARVGRSARARVSVAAEPVAAAARCAPRDELQRRARLRRRHARLRRPADGAEVARRRRRGGRARRRASRSLVAGDGPDREPLERLASELGLDGASASSARSRASACSSSSAPPTRALLSSSWENFPHTVVEALAVGTPVLATRRAASPRSSRTARTACSWPPGDAGALGAAIRPLLRRRELARAAARRGGALGRRVRARSECSASSRRCSRAAARVRDRACSSSAGRGTGCRSTAPARKWDALAQRSRRSRARERGGGSRPRRHVHARAAARRVLDGAAFYAALPLRVARELRALPAGRRRRAEPLRGARRRLGRGLARLAGRARRRRARRLAHVSRGSTARRSGARSRRSATASPASALAARRRRPHALRLHDRPRPRGRRRAGRAFFAVHRPRAVRRRRPPAARRAARALRRRARALQERRRLADAWRARRRALPGGEAPSRRRGHAGTSSSASSPSFPEQHAWTRGARAGRGRARARRRLGARPAVALGGLGRVVIEAFCRGRPVVARASAASATSSRTASTACSSTRRRHGARRRPRALLGRPRARAERLGARRPRAREAWLQYARAVRRATCATLVERGHGRVKPRAAARRAASATGCRSRRALERKFDALDERFELPRARERGRRGRARDDDRFRLVARRLPALDGLAFYARAPAPRPRGRSARFRPDAIVAAGPARDGGVLLGRRLARVDVPVILELHGDWRAATRLYGSPLRRRLCPRSSTRSPRRRPPRRRHPRRSRLYTTGLVRELGGSTGACSPPISISPRSSSARPAAARASRRRSSSACSSATRTSTGSSPRGGARRRACPRRGSVVVGRGRATADVE